MSSVFRLYANLISRAPRTDARRAAIYAVRGVSPDVNGAVLTRVPASTRPSYTDGGCGWSRVIKIRLVREPRALARSAHSSARNYVPSFHVPRVPPPPRLHPRRTALYPPLYIVYCLITLWDTCATGMRTAALVLFEISRKFTRPDVSHDFYK